MPLDYECPDATCDAFPYSTPEAAAACTHTRPGDPIRKAEPAMAGRVRPPVEAIRAAAPPTLTSSGNFVTVDNGFGGTTTRRAPAAAAAAARPANAPTERQTGYLRSLLAERAGLEPAEAIRARLNEARVAGTLDRRTVSKAIDDLLAITVVPAGSARLEADADAYLAVVPGVDPEPVRRQRLTGAVTIDKAALPSPARGVLRFAVPNESGALTFLAFKYRGEDVIVCQEIGGSGDDNYLGRQNAGTSYRGRLAHLVAKVMADPTEAMLTYGREIGRCGHCGTTLTHEASRAAGIGPVCAQKG